MSLLIVIRHGQASFFKEDYDQLSPKGELQAQRLGAYWAQQKFHLDRVIYGPRKRHEQTGNGVKAAYEEAGLAFPEPVLMEAFDEYPAEEVIKTFVPELVQDDPHIRELSAAFEQSTDKKQIARNFQKLFETVVLRWMRGELESEGLESWKAFQTRVHQGIEQILQNSDKNQTIAVFSSGGPMALTTQWALGCSDQKALELSWVIRNGAYCDFLFSAEKFTLNRFNTYPHLDDPAMQTYR